MHCSSARLGVGEVEGVGLSAAAHRHVGPFPVGGPVDDHEGAVGGDPLGFVPGEGVAVVDMPLVEVPDRQAGGFRGPGRAGPSGSFRSWSTLATVARSPLRTPSRFWFWRQRIRSPAWNTRSPDLEGGSVEPVRMRSRWVRALLVEFGDGGRCCGR